MSEPLVRLSRPGDINPLRDLDVCCYHYPLTLEEWREYVNGSGDDDKKARCCVVEVYRNAVGFGVWAKQDDNIMNVLRLGVSPKYRGNGLGLLLLDEINLDARRRQLEKLQIVVPDIHCQPGDPDDVSGFLNKARFKPTGKVIDNFCVMYGDDRAGYVWERPVL